MPSLHEFSLRLRAAMRDAARFPLLVLVIAASAVFAWLSIVWVVRVGQVIYHHYLEKPWV